MKPISDALRFAIDNLRKTRGNNAENTWELQIYRDRERMLGQIEGAQITFGPDDDIEPAVTQGNLKRYHVAFSRAGNIWYMKSGTTNIPAIVWESPVNMWAGFRPDLEFDGFFDNLGTFTPVELLMVYEDPAGTIKFRRRTYGVETWQSAVTVGSGTDPTIVRGWADPPDIGGEDQGLVLFCTQSGNLVYYHSDTGGTSWAGPIEIDQPVGGTKARPQVFRISDYTIGCVYEYDNGTTSEIWLLKTTRRYVNIASPDETYEIQLGGFRQVTFGQLELSPENETLIVGAGEYRNGTFTILANDNVGETVNPGAGEYRQVTFTGVNP